MKGVPSKQKIQNAKATDVLESETRKMEERLELVKQMMELEKEKRATLVNQNNGTLWRGAATSKCLNKNYAEQIVEDHKKKQPNLPPTNKVTHIQDLQKQQQPSTKNSARPINKEKAAASKQIVSGTSQTKESLNFVGSLTKK